MKPTFEATTTGLEIIDPIERRRYQLQTSRTVSPEPVEEHGIPFPIGTATRIVTGEVALPTTSSVLVRDEDGSMKEQIQPGEQRYLSKEPHILDISGPIKTYARVESTVYVYSDSDRTRVSFEGATEVIIGARSFHKRPAETITTTTAVQDVMAAVSTFRSALKTTSPERAFPTLRGHPPKLEIGDELEIPDTLNCLDTGVQIQIPSTFRHLSVVTPLSYYIGAEVVPGDTPKIVTEEEYSYSLTGDDGFEETVETVLKHLFLLDCVVRTEGPSPLHKQDEIGSYLNFDPETVYEQPLSKRIQSYLEVDSKNISSYFPNWRLETEISPTEDIIEFLPFFANGLAVIKTSGKKRQSEPASPETIEAINSFTRNDFTRSASPIRGDQDSSSITTQSETLSIPTVTQFWQGIKGSQIKSTTPVSAFYNDLGRTPRKDPIEIKVVCNDSDMREELKSVNGTYGTHRELPFEVSVSYNTTTDDFAQILSKQCDFLHYIGHIDTDGFQCSNGKLDAKTVDSVGAKAFLLNACQSHNQGLHLVEAGSSSGIVTFSDVVNSGAVKMGSVIAQLLNSGFPLYAALDVARLENIIGQQYLIVGNGRTAIAQSETPIPDICVIEKEADKFYVDVVAYGHTGAAKGGVFTPTTSAIGSYFTIPDRTGQIPITKSQLETFLRKARYPVLIGKQLYWSDEVDVDNI